MFVHWFADFVCQTHKMAINKSVSNYWLTMHVASYSIIMTGASMLAFGPIKGAFFGLVTFISHWITDYYTSRMSSKYFKVSDYHNGWVVVGADQWIHLACLMASYLMFK